METEDVVLEPTVLDSAPDEAAPAKPDLRKTWIISGAVAVVALCGAIVGVKALEANETPLAAAGTTADGVFMNRPTAGKITDIDGSSFTVKATDFNGSTSEVTVKTGKATTYTEQVDGNLSDLKVGDNVMATGTTADGVFTATRINEAAMMRFARNGDAPPSLNGDVMPAPPDGAAPPQGGQFFSAGGDGNFAGGEIKSIDGETLVLAGLNGADVTVQTTASTTIRVTKTIAFKDLKVGDTVRVQGTNANDTVTADNVTRGDDDSGLFGGGPRRQVSGGDSTTQNS